jgi:hypothetical protein
MRVAAGLPTSYWELAWEAAVYVRNRSPTSKNMDGMMPYQRLFGDVPDVSHLRVFGCQAEAHIPYQRRLKGQNKSEPGRFVGYDEQGRAYKFMPSGKKKWISTRDVTFYEEGSMGEALVLSPAGSLSPGQHSKSIVVMESDPAMEQNLLRPAAQCRM